VAAVWTEQEARERGALPTGGGAELVNNRLGSGSDYTVFLNFLGIPVADLTFDGPYGVYHSAYDNHHWVARIGDPGFRYHVALVQLWGIAALRLANADVIPLDAPAYAARIAGFVKEVARGRSGGPLPAALSRLEAAAADIDAQMSRALAAPDAKAVASINSRLVRFERAFLDPAGIPGRPWYRHQIFAPKFTYAAEMLPSLAEAIEGGAPAARVQAGEAQVAAALERAAAALKP
jgi:N-acetylated-alpha-linked acidic dipeptidase